MSNRWLKTVIVVLGTLTLVVIPASASNASTPFENLKYAIVEIINDLDSADIQPKAMNNELLCMAETVYRESGREPELGKLAVAQAIKNRMKHPLFPKTACKVVMMKTNIGGRIICQFSPYCMPRNALPTAPGNRSYPDWLESVAVAKLVLDRDDIVDITKGAQSFYAHAIVKPKWGGQVTLKLGGHTFVRTHSTWRRKDED
jgi:spore germination cell wall hydrolase CwlJ-like protein